MACNDACRRGRALGESALKGPSAHIGCRAVLDKLYSQSWYTRWMCSHRTRLGDIGGSSSAGTWSRPAIRAPTTSSALAGFGEVVESSNLHRSHRGGDGGVGSQDHAARIGVLGPKRMDDIKTASVAEPEFDDGSGLDRLQRSGRTTRSLASDSRTTAPGSLQSARCCLSRSDRGPVSQGDLRGGYLACLRFGKLDMGSAPSELSHRRD